MVTAQGLLRDLPIYRRGEFSQARSGVVFLWALFPSPEEEEDEVCRIRSSSSIVVHSSSSLASSVG